MHKLYSVSIYWGRTTDRDLKFVEQIEKVSEDWIRFSDSQWFLWSELPQPTVANFLRSVAPPGIQILVLQAETIAADGLAPDWIWNWLNSKMTERAASKLLGN